MAARLQAEGFILGKSEKTFISSDKLEIKVSL
jgi:hypothetical protein